MYHFCVGEPNLVPSSVPPTISPFFVSLTCGQNATLLSSKVATLTILCQIYNGSQPLTIEVFKNGVFFGNMFPVTITSFGDADFGEYAFVISTEKCGITSAVSWILPGKFF